MKIKRLLLSIMIFGLSWMSWAMEEKAAPKIGLIFTIHQKNLTMELRKGQTLNQFWDNYRKEFLEPKAKKIYNNVYFVIGFDIENNDLMRKTWAKALQENDYVDYVSFVHGNATSGDQYIKDEWEVPTDTKKLRLVYTEACNGGGGLHHFDKYNVAIAMGHGNNQSASSASPFFSFVVLDSLFNKASVEQAAKNSWVTGKAALESEPTYQSLAMLLGHYQDINQVMPGSKITIRYRNDIDPQTFTLLTGNVVAARDMVSYKEQVVDENGGNDNRSVLDGVFKSNTFLSVYNVVASVIAQALGKK